MKTVNDWQDYQILDMADGQKLERWQNVILLRPDPQIIWNEKNNLKSWKKIDAIYERSNTGGGQWNILNSKLPDHWYCKK